MQFQLLEVNQARCTITICTTSPLSAVIYTPYTQSPYVHCKTEDNLIAAQV